MNTWQKNLNVFTLKLAMKTELVRLKSGVEIKSKLIEKMEKVQFHYSHFYLK